MSVFTLMLLCQPTEPVVILMLFFVSRRVGTCIRGANLTRHTILLADIGCRKTDIGRQNDSRQCRPTMTSRFRSTTLHTH